MEKRQFKKLKIAFMLIVFIFNLYMYIFKWMTFSFFHSFPLCILFLFSQSLICFSLNEKSNMHEQLRDQQNTVLTTTLSKMEISLYKVYNSFQSQISIALRHKRLSILKTQVIWKGMAQSLLIHVTFAWVHLSHIFSC